VDDATLEEFGRELHVLLRIETGGVLAETTLRKRGRGHMGGADVAFAVPWAGERRLRPRSCTPRLLGEELLTVGALGVGGLSELLRSPS
jgi:hypothetical protein